MRRTTLAVLVVALLVAGACGNSEDDGAGSADEAGGGTPGVSDDTIRVGGVGSVTNPIGVKAGDALKGADAYFDLVNEDGGVDGREIDLVAQEDDSAQASRNASLVRSLVQQQDVFAVVPVATLAFSGARFLADEGVPTFGWNINTEWEGPENLFGEKGSYLCFDCGSPFLPFLARQAGLSNAGIIAYTAAQSAACAAGQQKSYERFGQEAGVQLVFQDTSLGFATRTSSSSGPASTVPAAVAWVRPSSGPTSTSSSTCPTATTRTSSSSSARCSRAATSAPSPSRSRPRTRRRACASTSRPWRTPAPTSTS
jgi:hypothetical protein